MDKSIIDFLNKITNACEGKLSIGREQLGKREFIVISVDGKEIYSFWYSPNKEVSKEPPKHTGGKPSYVKLMIEGIRKHTELSIEAAGFLVKMADNIQWGDNLLMDKRSKKSLAADDMCKIAGVGRNKTLAIINELKTAHLLNKDKDGYKLSTCLVQKGGAKE